MGRVEYLWKSKAQRRRITTAKTATGQPNMTTNNSSSSNDTHNLATIFAPAGARKTLGGIVYQSTGTVDAFGSTHHVGVTFTTLTDRGHQYHSGWLPLALWRAMK
jgi:hypothetical protein